MKGGRREEGREEGRREGGRTGGREGGREEERKEERKEGRKEEREVGWPRADQTCRITDVFGIGLNIMLERMQCSFQNVKQKKKDKENILQDELNKAKQTFECDPTNKMQAILIRRKKDWNIFMKKNFKVSSFAHGRDGVNTVKRVRNIFSTWRKGTMSKNMCEN